MKAFRISGRFRMGRAWQPFTKEGAAEGEGAGGGAAPARRRGMAVLDQYRSQLEALLQQQEIIRISLEEHMRARETLLRYQKAGAGAEVLMPVGANSFVVAEVRDPERAFVGIGSDLIVHDAIPAQLARLDARIKSISEAANAIGQRDGLD